jgi:Flp pilus assembly protein TadG
MSVGAWRRLARGGMESGVVAAELVLILPVLLLLVFGIIEFGAVFNTQISLTQATREAVRVGAVGQTPSVSNMEARLQEAYSGFVGPPVAEVTEACDPASETYTDDVARMETRVDFTFPISRFVTLPLRSEVVMRCGG